MSGGEIIPSGWMKLARANVERLPVELPVRAEILALLRDDAPREDVLRAVELSTRALHIVMEHLLNYQREVVVNERVMGRMAALKRRSAEE